MHSLWLYQAPVRMYGVTIFCTFLAESSGCVNQVMFHLDIKVELEVALEIEFYQQLQVFPINTLLAMFPGPHVQ